MSSIFITLDGEPQAWGRAGARIVRPRGKPSFIQFYEHPETAKYKKRLRTEAWLAMRSAPLLTGPVMVHILARFSVPKSWPKRDRVEALAGSLRPTGKPDWDNIGKLTDAFTGVIWKDDSQVVRATVEKLYSAEPGLAVTVTPLLTRQQIEIEERRRAGADQPIAPLVP